jgi:hypothetical protein
MRRRHQTLAVAMLVVLFNAGPALPQIALPDSTTNAISRDVIREVDIEAALRAMEKKLDIVGITPAEIRHLGRVSVQGEGVFDEYEFLCDVTIVNPHTDGRQFRVVTELKEKDEEDSRIVRGIPNQERITILNRSEETGIRAGQRIVKELRFRFRRPDGDMSLLYLRGGGSSPVRVVVVDTNNVEHDFARPGLESADD